MVNIIPLNVSISSLLTSCIKDKMPKSISQRGAHFIVKAFITTMMEIMDNELGKQLVFMNDKLAGREFM
ncbi:MAG: hypothetical protein KAT65_14825 [Methanophagales archaeon]|nr:hypothetical protein [Methanophagales archaeon]